MTLLKDKVQNFQTESVLSSRALKFQSVMDGQPNSHTFFGLKKKTTTSSLEAPPHQSISRDFQRSENFCPPHRIYTCAFNQMNIQFSKISQCCKVLTKTTNWWPGTKPCPYVGNTACLSAQLCMVFLVFRLIKKSIFHTTKIQISSFSWKEAILRNAPQFTPTTSLIALFGPAGFCLSLIYLQYFGHLI